jgi:hypothetical protein
MRSPLACHPFAVEAWFESSLVLAFAAPIAQLQPLIPAPLELDTFADRYGLLAVAMVQTRGLRPQGFPRWLGQDFFLIGYRIFVRHTDRQGRRLRGLYILASETDRLRMALVGNLFTRYRYSVTDIAERSADGERRIASERSGFQVRVASAEDDVPLPERSPFADWKQARRFAGPMPFTFSCDGPTHPVVIVEGEREHWLPRPVRVLDYRIPRLDALLPTPPILANAFAVRDVPYRWKKGRIDRCRE